MSHSFKSSNILRRPQKFDKISHSVLTLLKVVLKKGVFFFQIVQPSHNIWTLASEYEFRHSWYFFFVKLTAVIEFKNLTICYVLRVRFLVSVTLNRNICWTLFFFMHHQVLTFYFYSFFCVNGRGEIMHSAIFFSRAFPTKNFVVKVVIIIII